MLVHAVQPGQLKSDGSDTLLAGLAEAANAGIEAGSGFGWVTKQDEARLGAYFRAAAADPRRELLVATESREGRPLVVLGSVQLQRPSDPTGAGRFCAGLGCFFVHPRHRRRGAGRALLRHAERVARREGFALLQLDVRETQHAAIRLYESEGFVRWGCMPVYAMTADDCYHKGFFYSKSLALALALDPAGNAVHQTAPRAAAARAFCWFVAGVVATLGVLGARAARRTKG